MKKTYHVVLRLVVALTGATLAVDTFFPPSRRLLESSQIEVALLRWFEFSPLFIGVLVALEWPIMRNDTQERKAFTVDLAVWAGWCALYVAMLLWGLSHIPFL